MHKHLSENHRGVEIIIAIVDKSLSLWPKHLNKMRALQAPIKNSAH